jgi:hypothetical protein
MTIRMVAVSFEGADANPATVRTILGSTCQVAVLSGERTDRLAMLIEDQSGAKRIASTAPTDQK